MYASVPKTKNTINNNDFSIEYYKSRLASHQLCLSLSLHTHSAICQLFQCILSFFIAQRAQRPNFCNNLRTFYTRMRKNIQCFCACVLNIICLPLPLRTRLLYTDVVIENVGVSTEDMSVNFLMIL